MQDEEEKHRRSRSRSHTGALSPFTLLQYRKYRFRYGIANGSCQVRLLSARSLPSSQPGLNFRLLDD